MITIRILHEPTVQIVPVTELSSISVGDLKANSLVWVDMLDPSPEEEALILGSWFPVHELVRSDIRRARRATPEDQVHHPKVEDYQGYLFVIVHALRPEENQDVQLNIVIGANLLITHHILRLDAIEDLASACERSSRVFRRGPDYLLHLMLDSMVAGYLPLVAEMEDKLYALEESTLANPSQECLHEILDMKRRIQAMRRVVVYTREIVNRLARGDFELISRDESFYYRNVYDHLIRVADQLEAARELAMSLMEVYFSATASRLNQVIKVLTVISTIFLPLTFICSVYGMNFDFMPELRWKYGYAMVWGVIIIVAGSMAVLFRKRGWLVN